MILNIKSCVVSAVCVCALFAVGSAGGAETAQTVTFLPAEVTTNGLFGVSCARAEGVYAMGEVPLVLSHPRDGRTGLRLVLVPDYCATNGLAVAKTNLAEALLRAGFVSCVLPFTKDDTQIEAALEHVDALMVGGGIGVLQDYAKRCVFEHRVIAQAMKRGLPIAGICHGSQVINTYFGGTLGLTPQKRDERDFLIAHRMPVRKPYTDNFHLADLEPGSRIARVLGGDRAVINSSHSRHSLEMGKGLKVTARAPDGIVEAFEHETLPVMAFQFHPERMAFDARFIALLRESLSRGK